MLSEKSFESLNGIFVHIQAGDFIMGNFNQYDNNPPRNIYLSDYELSRFVVSNALWAKLMENGDANLFRCWENRMKSYQGFLDDDKPAVNISWNEWIRFCQLATVDKDNDIQITSKLKNEILKMNPKQFLKFVFNQEKKCHGIIHPPSEAQWEKAAKGGRGYVYGTVDGSLSYNSVVVRGETTFRICSKPANPFGLYDMTGNVWELLADLFIDDILTLPKNDPVNLDIGEQCCMRGGSWGGDMGCLDGTLRSTFRGSTNLNNWHCFNGFRPAKVIVCES